MKFFLHRLRLPILEACVCVGLCSSAFATTTNITASVTGSKASSVATNSAPSELPVPVSAFILTSQPTKDPFFPLTSRQPVPSITNAAPAFSAGSFVLKGLGGSAGKRLAMVNNRTFGVGDTNTVTTASGKVNVRCIQIKESSVVLRAEAQNEVVEIFLRKAAQ